MREESKVGCARPVGGPLGKTEVAQQKEQPIVKEVKAMITVGKKAPDFMAPAYYQRKFGAVQLSEYIGKWVILCFYPGDFTFV